MNTKVVSVTFFVAVLSVVGVHFCLRPGKQYAPTEKTSTVVEKAKPETPSTSGGNHAKEFVKGRNAERKRVAPGSVKHLKESPYLFRVVATTSGKAEDANWGINKKGSFLLTTYIDCEVEVLERDETPGGEIKVVEKRTYTSARQELDVSEADVSLSLFDTLPLDSAAKVAASIGAMMSVVPVPQVSAVGATVVEKTAAVCASLKAIDGRGARETLKKIGVNIPKSLEDKVNAFISKKVKTYIPFRPSDIEGKSYLFTYYQNPEVKGRKAPPLRVNVRRADGSKELSDQEWMILRRANAFLDCSFINREKEYKVGDTLSLESEDFECLFDPYVEGCYKGTITVERGADRNGDWYLTARPGSVAIVADDGRSTGELRIENGEARFDDKTCTLKAMVVSGKVASKKLSKHHLLFSSRIEGMCDFRAVLTTEVKK